MDSPLTDGDRCASGLEWCPWLLTSWDGRAVCYKWNAALIRVGWGWLRCDQCRDAQCT